MTAGLLEQPPRADAHLALGPAGCPVCRAKSCVHDLHCLGCCVRLVASTRPDKRKANAMLATLERVNGAPSREAVIAAMGGRA